MTRAAIRREVASIQPFDEQEEIHKLTRSHGLIRARLCFVLRNRQPRQNTWSHTLQWLTGNTFFSSITRVRSSGSRLEVTSSQGNTLEKRLPASSSRNSGLLLGMKSPSH